MADLAWLFGVTGRWIGKLRADGVLPADAPLPDLVKRMAAYQAQARAAKRTGYRQRADRGCGQQVRTVRSVSAGKSEQVQ
ncbi:hypothetical protein [Sphingomonas sp. ID0503]|uniref:hypothetical protein n=1 Tax=Sphingomonas sp. ID0503 TaxID=3399691 RepID=UPI003AFA362D